MAVFNFRPWLAILAALAIAASILYVGFDIEDSVVTTTGLSWIPVLTDISSLLIVFPLILLAAVLAGRLTGVNALALGQVPKGSGFVGLLLGLALISVAVGISFATGSAKFVGDGSPLNIPAMAFASLVYLIVAIGEEALFRGWLQPFIARYWGATAAAVIAAATFAAAHSIFVSNPPLVIANLFLGGLVMGFLAVRYGGIAAPVMFHFGWNWADYFFFALTPNPGKLSFGAIVDVDLSGSAQIGGIVDGMMANIFATLILLAMAAALFVSLRRSGDAPKNPTAKPDPNRKVAPPKPAATPQASLVAAPVAEPEPEPVADANVVPVASETQTVTAEAATLLEFGNTPGLEPVSDTAPAVQFATHEGCVRELNEDRFFTAEDVGVFVVADGMGGHKFGDRASTMIVEHVTQAAKPAALDEKVTSVSDAIRKANQAIFDEAQGNGSRMGSTVVGLAIEDNRYAVFWAGDSRAYRFRNGDVQQLTKDHTQVQEMVDRGLLKPEEASRHPMSHVLVRAVGVTPDFSLEESRGEIEPGDIFFLCSDGIYDVLEDDEIAALLAKSRKIDAMEKMIAMALDLGARDNVTGIIVRPDLAG
jgi:serine/threonine protein phosphatase Stp1